MSSDGDTSDSDSSSSSSIGSVECSRNFVRLDELDDENGLMISQVFEIGKVVPSSFPDVVPSSLSRYAKISKSPLHDQDFKGELGSEPVDEKSPMFTHGLDTSSPPTLHQSWPFQMQSLLQVLQNYLCFILQIITFKISRNVCYLKKPLFSFHFMLLYPKTILYKGMVNKLKV